MKIATVKESGRKERRTAITPEAAKKLHELGFECIVEKGCGKGALFSDNAYKEAGAEVLPSAAEVWQHADVVVKVRPPDDAELALLDANKTLISFVSPAQNDHLLSQLSSRRITTIAMDMIPRISRAQKLDALSSMANIAGYRAVTEAANEFGRFLGGQITAAGSIRPAHVLVIGAGVAGLAAIGAALSLGAVVRAFDVRRGVAEQIESMGAQALLLNFDEDGSGSGGYAAPSSPEFREKQLALFREQAREVDIVITTALIPEQEAPKLWLKDMVQKMKPGSIVVDLAAEQGGNCELTKKDQRIVTSNQVTILGHTDLASRMSNQASTLYANNIVSLMSDLCPQKDGVIVHDMEDEVIRSATVTHQGEITYPPPPLDPRHFVRPKKKEPPIRAGEDDKKRESRVRKNVLRNLLAAGSGALALLMIGYHAPPPFMQQIIVFLLACLIGFQVISNVSHALHTPLMSLTNAISGIVIVGALLQSSNANVVVAILAMVAVLVSMINIVGGFLITRRMLRMFEKS